MNDLLGMVKSGSASSRARPDVEAPAPASPDPAAAAAADPEMDKFFTQVAEIKALLADVRNHHNELEAAHEKSKTVTRSADVHALREAMQAEAHAISRSAEDIKRKLQALDAANEAALKKKGSGKGSASERTRTAVTAALKKKLKELMGEFQGLRTRVQKEYREVVERRVFTVTGQHASDEEIDRLIENGEAESVFQRAILEQGRGHVMDTLAEIRERRDAVMELEQSLMELHQIFLDMAVLVEAQGEMIDNIEAQVARSAEYVQTGVTHLQSAKQAQKKSRKWMCCALIMALCVIIAVIIAAVALSQAYVEVGTSHLVQAKRHQKRSRRCLCCMLIMVLLGAAAVAIVLGITLSK